MSQTIDISMFVRGHIGFRKNVENCLNKHFKWGYYTNLCNCFLYPGMEKNGQLYPPKNVNQSRY